MPMLQQGWGESLSSDAQTHIVESEKSAGLCTGKLGRQWHACAAIGPCDMPLTGWVDPGPCSARVQ